MIVFVDLDSNKTMQSFSKLEIVPRAGEGVQLASGLYSAVHVCHDLSEKEVTYVYLTKFEG